MAAAAATSTTAPASPAKRQELSIQRPSVSPLKRKRSSDDASDCCRASEPASPTSLDEVAASSSSSSNKPGQGGISPKKKAKKADADLSKWESHVVSSLAGSLDLSDCMDAEVDSDSSKTQHDAEPVPFSAAPAALLSADELHILQHFLA